LPGHHPALTEWRALDGSVKANLKKLILTRLKYNTEICIISP